jgi:hypothetical protein
LDFILMHVAVRNIPHWLVSSIRAVAISSLLSEMTNQVTWCGGRSADSVSLPGFRPKALPAPPTLPGVGWSDHRSFWQEGYPAIMITDTAVFRYPYYHTALDRADKVDFEKMARVVDGVRNGVASLSEER